MSFQNYLSYIEKIKHIDSQCNIFCKNKAKNDINGVFLQGITENST